jgi:hypothetical protein
MHSVKEDGRREETVKSNDPPDLYAMLMNDNDEKEPISFWKAAENAKV